GRRDRPALGRGAAAPPGLAGRRTGAAGTGRPARARLRRGRGIPYADRGVGARGADPCPTRHDRTGHLVPHGRGHRPAGPCRARRPVAGLPSRHRTRRPPRLGRLAAPADPVRVDRRTERGTRRGTGTQRALSGPRPTPRPTPRVPARRRTDPVPISVPGRPDPVPASVPGPWVSPGRPGRRRVPPLPTRLTSRDERCPGR